MKIKNHEILEHFVKSEFQFKKDLNKVKLFETNYSSKI